MKILSMNERVELNSKTTDFILYLVDKMAIPTKTSIIKMCYLCDLAAINSGLDPITDFCYIRYYYGPFDKKIDDYLFNLVKNRKLNVETEYGSGGGEYEKYSIPVELKNDNDYSDFLSSDEIKVVEPILESLGSLNAKMLTEIAYKTKPMTSIGAKLGGIEHFAEKLNLSAS